MSPSISLPPMEVLAHQFQAMASLADKTSKTSNMAQETRNVFMALDDLIVLMSWSHIEVVKAMLSKGLDGMSKEIGKLLDCLWTRLGGNRALIADAHLCHRSLVQAEIQTMVMKAIVCNACIELSGMQEDSEVLRSYAAEPLLVGRDLPHPEVVRALCQGCKTFQKRMKRGDIV
ncbi:hypothetical protein L208DRAFT_1380421 [Tricholoma matsutake]|nr:hypothetical protein L208DRAFT_1380421 [Tricholoma matsutake 945]